MLTEHQAGTTNGADQHVRRNRSHVGEHGHVGYALLTHVLRQRKHHCLRLPCLRGQVSQKAAGPEGGVALGAGEGFSVSDWLGVKVGERRIFHREKQCFPYSNQLLKALIEIVG